MAEMMKEVVVVEPHKYEVREVEIPEGIMYVSFWNADDYFMLNEEEFDKHLIEMKRDQSCQIM